MRGLTPGEEYFFQIFNINWSEVYNCGWQCGNTQTVTGLPAGDYRVFIKDSGYQVICEKVITLTNGSNDPDNDGDGFPASEDCNDNDPNLTIVGASCDDGNSETINDLVQSDCSCLGTTPPPDGTTVSCGGNTTITYGNGVVTMAGPSGGEYFFQIFNINWSEVYNCGWQCGNPVTVSNLPPGDYRIFIKDSGYQIICETVITLTNGTNDPDNDGDGFPASTDCNDNDANLTIVGASCDDGNSGTTNDIVQANCTCAGVTTTGGTTVSCGGNTSITYGNGFITMSGPSPDEEYYFQIFDLGWNEVYNCGWQCGNPLTVTGLAAGGYRVFIKDSGYQVICEKVITLTGGAAPSFLILEPTEDGPIAVESTDELKGFTLFPNPTFDLFNVNFDSRIGEEYTVIISDLLGREHYRTVKTALRNKTNLEVNSASWKPGVYFVRLVNDKQKMKIKRIVIARE